MEEGWDTLAAFGKELAEEAAMACLPYGNLAKLKSVAKGLYPLELGDELHHVTPLYPGGARNGPRVLPPGSYHQLITNAFRNRWPYGTGKPTQQELIEIIDDVYETFPLFKGTGF